MKTTASTHTGGALFEVGTMAAGYKPIWGVEIRPDIADVAEANIPGLSVIRSDVALVNWSSLERPYHFHSSPSCKNASLVKVESGESPEDLSSARAICQALKILLPPVYTLENVWLYRNFESFKMIVSTLRELGYCLDWWKLTACNYGVPQQRQRLILIASRDFQPVRPAPTHSATPDLFGVYKRWVSWWDAIEDLESGFEPWRLADWQKKILPAHNGYLLVGNNQGSDTRDKLSSARKDEPAFTVTVSNSPKIRAIVKNKVVRLGIRAIARLQSVPDEYHLPDANGLACEIIGNGVACKLAQAIMESIR